MSSSPPPTKRRAYDEPSQSAVSEEIWRLFGKSRGHYMSRDVYSDDEDMEAGIFDVEREEKQRWVLVTSVISPEMLTVSRLAHV